MNAIESCLKVYKDCKGLQLKLTDTFLNQHSKAEDLVCTTTPADYTRTIKNAHLFHRKRIFLITLSRVETYRKTESYRITVDKCGQ